MIVIFPEGTTHGCRSEDEFIRSIHDKQGVYVANINIPNSVSPGAPTREVDGVLITTDGIYTVEVKGLRADGILNTPRMDGWFVQGADGHRVPFAGRPHTQALLHSKFLSSFLRGSHLNPGWIQAVLAIVTDDVRLPGNDEIMVTENVHVVLVRPEVDVVELLRRRLAPTNASPELSLETVREVLTALGCVDLAPTIDELTAEGFRFHADLQVEAESRRKQVLQEYERVAAKHEGPSVSPVAPADMAISSSPSTTEWAITQERYEAVVALDAELTETGAFVHGVAMHKRLVGYAHRKGLDLETIAAIVNNPEQVLADTAEANDVYCSGETGVVVRALDGLALYYKPVAVIKAEREGGCVDGVEISARAAKQALCQFSLSLEAVARIVLAAEERWWMPRTGTVAHARGDFVAVTDRENSTVQYVQTRALAVSRAESSTTRTESDPVSPPQDETLDGVTIRASVMGWCNRTGIPASSLRAIATTPTITWEGHSANIEVRSNRDHSVLYDTRCDAVVAVMALAEAVEYRDGVSRSGVHISGRCVFLAKRRKCSVDEIVDAYRNPVTVARAVGSTFTYYIGSALAVTVDDETQDVVDFTYCDHARAMLRRGELVAVGESQTTIRAVASKPVEANVAPRPVPSPPPGRAHKPGEGATVVTDGGKRQARPSPLLMGGKKRPQ